MISNSYTPLLKFFFLQNTFYWCYWHIKRWVRGYQSQTTVDMYQFVYLVLISSTFSEQLFLSKLSWAAFVGFWISWQKRNLQKTDFKILYNINWWHWIWIAESFRGGESHLSPNPLSCQHLNATTKKKTKKLRCKRGKEEDNKSASKTFFSFEITWHCASCWRGTFSAKGETFFLQIFFERLF